MRRDKGMHGEEGRGDGQEGGGGGVDGWAGSTGRIYSTVVE